MSNHQISIPQLQNLAQMGYDSAGAALFNNIMSMAGQHQQVSNQQNIAAMPSDDGTVSQFHAGIGLFRDIFKELHVFAAKVHNLIATYEDNHGPNAGQKRKMIELHSGATPEKKVKKIKDKNAPKKPLSSYMIFSQENRDRIIRENPGVKFQEVGTITGQEWNKLSEDQKKHYNDLAEKDRKRYENEKKQYDASLSADAQATNAVESMQEEETQKKKKKKTADVSAQQVYPQMTQQVMDQTPMSMHIPYQIQPVYEVQHLQPQQPMTMQQEDDGEKSKKKKKKKDKKRDE